MITWLTNNFSDDTNNGKTGLVRLIDVFFIAPYLIGLSTKQKTPTARNLLFIIGVATLVYNGANYLKYNANTK
jgi:hypothetical protein|tara:strand:- start:921 stop:1139 length:219 start_codon:yes stop_codon:yes gene_type:complete